MKIIKIILQEETNGCQVLVDQEIALYPIIIS